MASLAMRCGRSDQVHVLAFTLRGEKLRIISLRKANRKESARYARSL